VNEKGILDFKAGRLDVACREIDFVPTDGRLPRIVGPGRIYQSSEGHLRFTAYPTTDLPDIELPPRPAGSVIPGERTWSLRATDPEGRRWKAERLWLDLEERCLSPDSSKMSACLADEHVDRVAPGFVRKLKLCSSTTAWPFGVPTGCTSMYHSHVLTLDHERHPRDRICIR
jgi:hypothetical protein